MFVYEGWCSTQVQVVSRTCVYGPPVLRITCDDEPLVILLKLHHVAGDLSHQNIQNNPFQCGHTLIIFLNHRQCIQEVKSCLRHH